MKGEKRPGIMRQRRSQSISRRERLYSFFEKNRKTVYKAGLVVLVMVLALGFYIKQSSAESVILEEESEAAELEESAADGRFYVDISGAVNSPGVYEVDSDTRLFELIDLAGGLKSEADLDAINRADFLTDGQKVVIPSRNPEGDAAAASAGSSASSSGKININTADKTLLMEIPGIGEVIASRIIDYRTETRFQSIEDIKEVSGIGEATFEKMKEYITV